MGGERFALRPEVGTPEVENNLEDLGVDKHNIKLEFQEEDKGSRLD